MWRRWMGLIHDGDELNPLFNMALWGKRSGGGKSAAIHI
jgi:hypothetical protein